MYLRITYAHIILRRVRIYVTYLDYVV